VVRGKAELKVERFDLEDELKGGEVRMHGVDAIKEG
jgi:hypothetical protein